MGHRQNQAQVINPAAVFVVSLGYGVVPFVLASALGFLFGLALSGWLASAVAALHVSNTMNQFFDVSTTGGAHA